MENKNEITSDIKGLINILDESKEAYASARDRTESTELKGLVLYYAAKRSAFAEKLKNHLAVHGAESGNKSGGIPGALHRNWIDDKQALTSK